MGRVGYPRVSTTDQDLDIQIARLKAVGCDIVRHETGSGASRAGRTELETIMQFLRSGDELVVLRLDRLGRSTRDVLNLVHELDERGASLRVLEPEVTTSGDMGRMVVTILGMVADMELKFIKDRQRARIEAAKAEGVYRGRRKNVDDEEIRRRIAAGASKADVARQLKVFEDDRLQSPQPHRANGDRRTAQQAAFGDSRPTSDRRELQQTWSWQEASARAHRGNARTRLRHGEDRQLRLQADRYLRQRSGWRRPR